MEILAGCLKSSLFPPREELRPVLADWEFNRGRWEWRTVISSEATDPRQAGFPSARQAICLKRRVLHKDKKTSDENVHIISSLEPQKLNAADIKKIKRDYWSIESEFHYRLDEILDEDRSRVRTPKAALVLGMFRRLVLSFAIPWIAGKQRTHKRTSTRDFLDQLKAEKAHRAFNLITSKSPTSWKN